MYSDWMGRYRPLIAAIVKHGNVAVNGLKHRSEIIPGIMLTATEWQVLEAVIEHEHQPANMNRLTEEIGIPQSTFSKTVTYLCSLGLIEKHQTASNRKNILLQPTGMAREAYQAYSEFLEEQVFKGFFQELEQVDDSALEAMTKALRRLCSGMQGMEE